MKKLILLVIPVIFGLGSANPHRVQSVDTLTLTNVEPNFVKPTYTLEVEPLIEAMIWVESRGDDSAYCKREDAVGCLQIRPIMLRECNRILGIQKSELEYALEDRWSREKSIEIFHIVNSYHNKNNTYEAIARSWNGGSTWAQKSNTKKYWRKVNRQLKKQQKDEHSDNGFANL
jgi:hypothetical protein